MKVVLIVLVVIVLIAGAGAGGYYLGDQAGFARANQVRQSFLANRFGQGNQNGGGGFGAGGGQNGNGQTGGGGQNRVGGIQAQIKSVDNNTVTVTVGQRDVKVQLTDQTTVEQASTGSKTDLKAGQRVLVTPERAAGTTTSGDSINASSILILPAQQ